MRALLIGCVVLLGATSSAVAQQGAAERLGERIDRGIDQIGTQLRQTWEEIRAATNRMGVEARVYARLYWDKKIHNATLDIEVRKDGIVVLKGSVPDAVARAKAVELTRDTLGVSDVVDELTVPTSR